MAIVIKAHPSSRTKSGGSIHVSCKGQRRIMKAVVFSWKESVVLKKAADNATIIKK